MTKSRERMIPVQLFNICKGLSVLSLFKFWQTCLGVLHRIMIIIFSEQKQITHSTLIHPCHYSVPGYMTYICISAAHSNSEINTKVCCETNPFQPGSCKSCLMILLQAPTQYLLCFLPVLAWLAQGSD